MQSPIRPPDRAFFQTLMENDNHQIVIAVSSRALFDLEQENRIFEEQGIEAYRSFQLAHIEEPLAPGVAFPFIRRLLRINDLFPGQQPFQVVVLSRNSPETGQRFFTSCRHHGLQIRAGAFTSGQNTFPYLSAFNASLFLSADKQSVINAVAQGQPAGWVLPSSSKPSGEDAGDTELRIAFDFDGVIIDDEPERQYQKTGLSGFQQYEVTNKATPHKPGPLHKLFSDLAHFQELDARRGGNDPYYRPAIRISIVTARGEPSEQRLITTLKSLGMHAAELFLLDGLPKKRILDVLKPHIFFDDQLRHLEPTREHIPSVLIPFGITNV